MKYKSKYAAFAAFSAFLGLAAAANAEESVTYSLEPEQSYELDLQGDGVMEQLSYKTYTIDEEIGESKAVLDIYLNDTLFWSITDESWSYHWQLCQCPLSDGNTYLLATSFSDNDWNSQVLLLEAADDSFETVADLTSLTRQEADEPGKLLSSWSRSFDIIDVQDSSFTVNWLDTLKATGGINIPVTYILKDGEVALAESFCHLDEEKEWTAWRAFDVMEGTSGDAAASVLYQVEPGDTVHLTEYVKVDEKVYVKCINQDGQEGWMPDAEDYYSEISEDGTDYLCGYFEEAIYAG